jgi:superfamily I DNA/RNA helicase
MVAARAVHTLDTLQNDAVQTPFDDALSIVGRAATGKTTALLARLDRARASGFTSPLLAGFGESPSLRLHTLAEDVLCEAGAEIRLIDDADAEAHFEAAAAPLLAMETEMLELQIDPEIPGIRSPERFLESAFRLWRNLAEALIDPEIFLERALAGATQFYAHPPNFAHPRLLAATEDKHRSALAVSQAELERQYRREIDLAKMLAQLFRAYVRVLHDNACATGRDAIAFAVQRLREDPSLGERFRHICRLAFIDDAQELTSAELALMKCVFGDTLAGVTLAGDPAARLRPGSAEALALATNRIELRECYRARVEPQVSRSSTQREEAQEIASYVERLLCGGAQPTDIAILLRWVEAATRYEEALLERNIPVQIVGDYNIFSDRRSLDALALLWNVHDPFRHDYLLRTLSNPAVHLSDASLAILCGEPVQEQTALFEEIAARPPSEAQHRDPMRAVRLGRNLLSGERDGALSDVARERVQRFRELRERWVEAQKSLPFEDFARLVWHEGLAREGALGSARARVQQAILQRLHARLCDLHKIRSSLGNVLAEAERRSFTSLETCESIENADAVAILSLEAAHGRSFDHVIVANVKPGSFPRWYAPDAFFFSPKLGMVPKDNVGDAPTARTAKFTFYLYRVKARERYYEHERRRFNYARSRANRSLLVTASGRATRGISAPEFLEELR